MDIRALANVFCKYAASVEDEKPYGTYEEFGETVAAIHPYAEVDGIDFPSPIRSVSVTSGSLTDCIVHGTLAVRGGDIKGCKVVGVEEAMHKRSHLKDATIMDTTFINEDVSFSKVEAEGTNIKAAHVSLSNSSFADCSIEVGDEPSEIVKCKFVGCTIRGNSGLSMADCTLIDSDVDNDIEMDEATVSKTSGGGKKVEEEKIMPGSPWPVKEEE